MTSRIALPVLLIAEAIVILLLLWRPEIDARLDSTQFRPENGQAYLAVVPPIAPYLRKLPSDGPDSRDSGLLLFRDGQILGPAHSKWAVVREKGAGAYVHWGGVLIFSTPGNVNPRTDGATYTLRTPLIWSATPHAILIALALLCGALICRSLLRFNSVRAGLRTAAGFAERLWRNPRAALMAPAHLAPRFRLIGRVALAALTIALTAAVIAFAYWRPLVVAELDPHQFTPERGHLFQIRVSTLAPAGYQLGGDDIPAAFRSEVALSRNGSEFGRGHAGHDEIRRNGGGLFSLWSGVLFMSTPENTDPRTDGATYSIAGRAEPTPQMHGLMLLLVLGLAAVSLLSAAVRDAVRLIDLRSRSLPGRTVAALVVAAAIGTHLTGDWNRYVNVADSSSYLRNPFVELSTRQPGVYVWHWIFSDPEAIKRKFSQIEMNVHYLAEPGDPVIPGIKAQRLLMGAAYAAIAFAMGFLVHPILALLACATLVSPESMSAMSAAAAIAAGCIVLFAIWRGRAPPAEKVRCAGSVESAKTGILARGLSFALALLGVTVTAWVFFPMIFQNSFLSQEEVWFASDPLMTAWLLFFVAALMWFLRTGAIAALFLCAVLASLGVLTRPAAVFAVVLFVGLCAIALYVNWRRFLAPVVASGAVALILINSVTIYATVTGRRDVGVVNATTTVVIAFALSISQPEDEKVLDDTERRFFRAALARRDAALARVTPGDPAAKWSGIVEIYNETAWPAAIAALGRNNIEEVNALFLRVTRKLALNRPLEYAHLMAESLAVSAGVSRYSITRMFHSYTDWIVLLGFVALTMFGPARDRMVGLTAAFLVAGHFGHLMVATISVTPTLRYAQSTEWMIVVAILLLIARNVEVMWRCLRGKPLLAREPLERARAKAPGHAAALVLAGRPAG